MDYSEDHLEDLQEVKYENLTLQQKIEMMQKLQTKLVNDTKKKPVKMFAPKSFRKEKTNSECNVSSQINHDLIMEQKKYKEELAKQKKAEMELKDCTFKPKINKVSASLMQSQQYIPVFDRPLPEKRPDPPKPDEIEEDRMSVNSEDENRVKKKADPEFYKRQLEWKQKQEEKKVNERLAKQLSEYESTKAVPKVNKKKNEKILAEQPKFMDRMKQDMDKSKALKEQLDQKYNNLSFKPKINKNVPVKSIVSQTLQDN
jgi:hypothetical protein